MVEGAGIERVAICICAASRPDERHPQPLGTAPQATHDQVPRGQVHAGTVTTVMAAGATGSCWGLHKDTDEMLSDLRESLSFLRGLGMQSTLTRTLPAVVITLAV